MAGESAQQMPRRARDEVGRLEPHAAACESGCAGEAATASLLDQLPPPWSALHDLRWPGRQGADLDHVVVGPGGIFVIDSEDWSGGVTVTDGVLRQNGYRRDREVAAAADAAVSVAEVVAPHGGSVQAVLCFTGQARVVGRAGDVALCHLENLWRFLLTRPEVLDPQQVAEANARLGAALVPASRPGAVVAATRPVRRPRASERRRAPAAPAPAPARPGRRPRPARRLLVSLVMACAMLSLGPAVVRSVASEAPRVVPALHGACDASASTSVTRPTQATGRTAAAHSRSCS